MGSGTQLHFDRPHPSSIHLFHTLFLAFGMGVVHNHGGIVFREMLLDDLMLMDLRIKLGVVKAHMPFNLWMPLLV